MINAGESLIQEGADDTDIFIIRSGSMLVEKHIGKLIAIDAIVKRIEPGPEKKPILQVKVFSIKRIMNKIGMINKEDFKVIVEKSKNLFGPT